MILDIDSNLVDIAAMIKALSILNGFKVSLKVLKQLSRNK